MKLNWVVQKGSKTRVKPQTEYYEFSNCKRNLSHQSGYTVSRGVLSALSAIIKRRLRPRYKTGRTRAITPASHRERERGSMVR